MKKRIVAYRKRIDNLLAVSGDENVWDEILEEHLVQISFFQHERLVHLIVTMTVALLTLISLVAGIMTAVLGLYALTAMFAVLLVPYILHYYTLENEVQRMYSQYDEILKYKSKRQY